MKMRILSAPTLCLLIGLTSGRVAHSQVAAVPKSPTTIWNFLGIPQGVNKIRDATVNRRGNFPGLERQPPLKAIADPSNLVSGVPAMEAAAEIKQAEDLKKQKIKAIKYLATVGCGCYDKDKKITKALIASMEDCTEEVRLAAVEAVITAADNKECARCHSACCCGKEVVEKLSQIAYERDETGCFIEPSERVRDAAREALAACCPNRLPLSAVEPLPAVDPNQGGEEVIPGTTLPGVTPEGTVPMIPPPAPPSDIPATETSAPDSGSTAAQWNHRPAPITPARTRLTSSRRTHKAPITQPAATELDAVEPPSMTAIFELQDSAPAARQPAPTSTQRKARPVSSRPVSSRRGFQAPAELPASSGSGFEAAATGSLSDEADTAMISSARGHVEEVDLERGLVKVHLHNKKELPTGGSLKVYHEYLAGRTSLTKLEVVHSTPGVAYARATELGKINKIARGDNVVGW